jgi:uroporphyrinogen decarboxylase
MTPKQRIVAALELEEPDDIVPTFELFGLTKELTGKEFTPLAGLSGQALDRGVRQNAELHVEVAERLDYSAIVVGDLRVVEELVRAGTNDTYLLTYKNGDGTWRFWQDITGASQTIHTDDLAQECVRLFTEPDEVRRELDQAASRAIERTKPLIDAGVEAVFMGADYATTKGPFLSPAMFATFVAPYLERIVAGHHENGAYVLKHTDGDIMPLLDQIVDCRPDALVSIDPTAGMDMAVVKRLVGDRICLAGNVDVAALMEGSEEKIRKSALYCLRHGVPGGGYIYMSANSVYPPVDIEDYLLMLDMRREYGRYDRQREIPTERSNR